MLLKRTLKFRHHGVLAFDQRHDPISDLLCICNTSLLDDVVLISEISNLILEAVLATNDVDRHRRENGSEDPEVDQGVYKLRRHKVSLAQQSALAFPPIALLPDPPATTADMALQRRVIPSTAASARRAVSVVVRALIADEGLATFLMEADEVTLASDGAPADGADEHRPHFAASSPRMPASSWRNALVNDAASFASFKTPPVSSAIF